MTVISYKKWLVMGLLTAGGSLQAALSADAPVGAERFEPVKMKHYTLPYYDYADVIAGHEGWVIVSTMVDAQGKPYETAVESSTGDPEFDRSAVAAMAHATLEPARLNGKPIDSVFRMKLVFIGGLGQAARPSFVDNYEAFGKALEQNDRARAKATLELLQVKNLEEDAYLGLAQYRYAARYQDEQAQIAGLERAIANEATAKYLPTPMFVAALRTLFKLQVETHYYNEALDTWKKLQKVDHDAQVIGQFKKVAAAIEASRSDPTAYAVTTTLKDGGWFIDLMRSRFRIEVPQGHVTDLKVRCEKTYLSFPYDPQIEYHVPERSGKCQLQLTGEPGSLVRLTQS